MKHRLTTPGARLAVAAVAAVALSAAACGGSSGGGSGAPSGGTPVNGGTASFALTPNATPNYILPFEGIQYFSVVNAQDFQYLMYRPLYYFGQGTQLTVNYPLSLANPPVFSGATVTINLKNYKWSDGSPLTSRDVLFWLHMEQAEKTVWADYVPGEFPDNIKSISAPTPSQVVLTMDKVYSQKFLLYNEFSQITPLPQGWDKTSTTTKGHCTDSASGCPAVWKYLSGQAASLATYATNPLWQIVDGPWRLKSFNADGHVSMVPNPSYSGPTKPRLAQFDILPYTTDAAEYNALRSGSPPTVGYLPTEDAPAKPANKDVGKNPVANYTLEPWYAFGINYFPLNFNAPDPFGSIVRQLYFRTALQDLMDQKSVLNGPLRGYGSYTVGPVPNTPATFLSPTGKRGDPFPFNPAQAKQLLTSHGWSVVPGGVDTCTNATLCGAGIKAGDKLQFTLQYATGSAWVESEMKALQSNASSVGIKIDLKGAPFNTVTGTAVPCAKGSSTCSWQAGDWGQGWIFSPDYYPTGDTLYATGAGSNSSNYSDRTDDQMIGQTLTSSDPGVFNSWQDYLARQLPDVWQPNGPYQLTEVSSRLRGYVQNNYLTINPENWYYVK